MTEALDDEPPRVTSGLIRVAVAFLPLITILNGVGIIGAGIWLAIAGDWWAIGYGIVAMITAHFAVGLLMIPSFLLAAPGMRLMETGRRGAARLLMAASSLYVNVLMVAWCVFVTAFYMGHQRAASAFPVMLWSYGVACSPWTYLASKDQQAGGGNEFSLLACIFLQAGYIVGALALLLTGTPMYFTWALIAAMGGNWIVQQSIIAKTPEFSR